MKRTLHMTITPGASGFEDELRIGEPYPQLKSFFSNEVSHRVRSCENWLADVRTALAGEPIDTGYGNAWKIEIDATTARFHNAYEAEPLNRFEMPTPLLREALERWLAHLLAQGYKRSELVDD
ncbi:MAG: hypothetical protein KC657_19570 [Myxococcales bacterium]|nr:hypothetical protein [Myxococcales bacterium]